MGINIIYNKTVKVHTRLKVRNLMDVTIKILTSMHKIIYASSFADGQTDHRIEFYKIAEDAVIKESVE